MRAILLAVALMGAAGLAQETPAGNKVLATPGGRYVFGQVNDVRSDQFMLDTQTGRLWRIVEEKESGRLLLQIVRYRLLDGTMAIEPIPVVQEYDLHDKKLSEAVEQSSEKK
jgi:hypothetical protein